MMRRTSFLALGTSCGSTKVPTPINEPCLHFAPGSPERALLKKACLELRKQGPKVIPVVINGKRYYPGEPVHVPIPSDNKTSVVAYHEADEALMKKAVESSLDAQKKWSRVPFQDRAAIMLRASNLLTKTRRYDVMASTMIGQSKNVWQAEIDCITEAVDFLRFHVKFAEDMYACQPVSPTNGATWNMTEYRPLEGFVAAISPFNFTAIGTNLAATPALMGNTVLWKPSPGALYGNYETFCLLEEAGVPPGVINFVPTSISAMEQTLQHPELAGVAFTGSTAVFRKIWKQVASNLENYKNFPRISGECGGKNFHLVHSSAHIPSVVAGTIRSSFEYQGQKCSACSRLFVPKSKWTEIRDSLISIHQGLKQGQPDDFESFLCAVINEDAYNKNVRYIELAKKEGCEVLAGGGYSSEKGWFIEPTILLANDLNNTTLREEIFGPVLTVYVYDDAKPNAWEDICSAIDKGTGYGLTGSIWSLDRAALRVAQDRLRYSSGMLYVNDKSTGAVVGQQPFGGGRHSGTNDKPGGASFVEKWVQPRTIKETLEYIPEVNYPHMRPE
eukprot:Tbor_TRINITY_DN5184_c1_g2::TRINITY_DN5184_c1_g2_i1::g.25835::m.25835/K00294/E1.2.1.88; 1-pyrroline-5-carboxylate dehydrogenase